MNMIDLPLHILIIAWIGRRQQRKQTARVYSPVVVLGEMAYNTGRLLAAMPIITNRLGRWCRKQINNYLDRLHKRMDEYQDMRIILIGRIEDK